MQDVIPQVPHNGRDGGDGDDYIKFHKYCSQMLTDPTCVCGQFRYVRLKPGCDSATRIDKFILLSDQTGAQINGLLDDLWKKTHLWKAINVS